MYSRTRPPRGIISARASETAPARGSQVSALPQIRGGDSCAQSSVGRCRAELGRRCDYTSSERGAKHYRCARARSSGHRAFACGVTRRAGSDLDALQLRLTFWGHAIRALNTREGHLQNKDELNLREPQVTLGIVVKRDNNTWADANSRVIDA